MGLGRLGHFVFRYRWLVICTWLILIIPGIVVAPTISSHLAHGAYSTKSGESAEGAVILESELGIRPNVITVVFSSDTLMADDPIFMDEVDQALIGITHIEGLAPPMTYRGTGDPRMISEDGRTTYALIGVDGDVYKATKLVPDIRDSLEPQPHVTALVTGRAPFHHDGEAVAMDDLQKAEQYTFPLVAIVLIVVFGSLVAAIVPLAIGGVSVIMALGIVFVLSQFIDINSSSLSVVSFIGLGISIDFSLLMVSRFREELAKGIGTERAVVTTLATSGKAILYSSITGMIGLGALISFDMSIVRSL